jgi:methyl-accepting chemotaxis protein
MIFQKDTFMKSWIRGIKGRLFFTSIFPFIAFGIIFAFTLNGLNKLSALLQSAHTEIIPNISVIDDLRIYQNRFGYRMWEGIVNPEDRKEVGKECHESLDGFKAAYKKYTSLPFAPEEKKIYETVKEDFPKYISLAEEIMTEFDKNTPDSIKIAQKILDEKLHEESTVLEAFNEAVTDYYDKRAKAEATLSEQARAEILRMMIVVTFIAGFVIMGTLMWIAARISRSVGDIATRLTEAGGNVASSVEQLSQAGNTLSQSSTESAASLEETVAALEEMSSMVQMNSDNAKQAASLAMSSRDSAERGEKEIQNLIKSMNEISTSSKKIEEIISVIDDIAFQTNLLALNAAVEAARAGEQGKGFAVVAEAVRALAQRSASSAKDIAALIKTSVEQVQHGSTIADKSGEVLGNIVTSIKKVSDLNSEIAAASSEQTTGIQQISKAMNQLDQSSQSNAASAEEIAATTGEINNLALTTKTLTVELNEVIAGPSEHFPAA